MSGNLFGVRTTALSPTELVGSIRTLTDSIPKRVILPALREHVRFVKDGVKRRIDATGIAQGLARTGKSTATLSGKRSKGLRRPASDKVYAAVYTQGSFSARPVLTVTIWGMASIIDQGLRTKPHDIPFDANKYAQGRLKKAMLTGNIKDLRRNAKKLRRLWNAEKPIVMSFGGKYIRGQVRHPGSKVRAAHAVDQTLADAYPRVMESIEYYLKQAQAQVGLA